MSLVFLCPQCGKQFEVATELGGKRGKCKDCGSLFRIPKAEAAPTYSSPTPDPYKLSKPAPSPPTTRPTSANPPSPYEKPQPRSFKAAYNEPPQEARIPTPASVSSPVVVDPYGLDEPATQRPSYDDDSYDQGYDEPVSPIPRRKKRSSTGFFSKGKAKSSASGSHNRSGLGLSIGGIASVLVTLVGFAMKKGFTFGIGSLFGILSYSDMERTLEKYVDQTNRMATTLQTVHDPGTAHEAGPKVAAILREQIDLLRGLKDKKVRKSSSDSLSQKYKPKQEAAVNELVAQLRRISLIPGAMPPLLSFIQTPLDELGSLETELGAPSGSSPQPHFGPMFGGQRQWTMHGPSGPMPPTPIMAGPGPQPMFNAPPMPPPSPPQFGRPMGPRFGPRMH